MEKKVAIVTGGGKGIGEAIVKQLVEDGFYVAIAEVDKESADKLAESLNGHAKSYYANVGRKDDVFALVENVVNDFGRLDVMINNAGLSREYSLLDMSEEQFDELWEVNVKGVL